MKSWSVQDAKAGFSEMLGTCATDGPQLYNALRHGVDYVDPGSAYYGPRYRDRFIENIQRRAKAFGFVL